MDISNRCELLEFLQTLRKLGISSYKNDDFEVTFRHDAPAIEPLPVIESREPVKKEESPYGDMEQELLFASTNFKLDRPYREFLEGK